MTGLFRFFLRLFFCLVAAKFLLRVFQVDSRGYLLGLTALLTANVYGFDYLAFREHRFDHPVLKDRPGLEAAAGEEEPSPHSSPPKI